MFLFLQQTTPTALISEEYLFFQIHIKCCDISTLTFINEFLNTHSYWCNATNITSKPFQLEGFVTAHNDMKFNRRITQVGS